MLNLLSSARCGLNGACFQQNKQLDIVSSNDSLDHVTHLDCAIRSRGATCLAIKSWSQWSSPSASQSSSSIFIFIALASLRRLITQVCLRANRSLNNKWWASHLTLASKPPNAFHPPNHGNCKRKCSGLNENQANQQPSIACRRTSRVHAIPVFWCNCMNKYSILR